MTLPQNNKIYTYTVFTLQENMKYGRPDIYTDENKIKVGIFEDFIIEDIFLFE